MSRELLFSVTKKDLEIETFRAGGKGGQNQNKRDSGVRIRHPASGAVAESREHRGQLANKKAAFRRLTETREFKRWMRQETSFRLGLAEEVEETIRNSLRPEDLKLEIREGGKWKVVSE